MVELNDPATNEFSSENARDTSFIALSFRPCAFSIRQLMTSINAVVSQRIT